MNVFLSLSLFNRLQLLAHQAANVIELDQKRLHESLHYWRAPSSEPKRVHRVQDLVQIGQPIDHIQQRLNALAHHLAQQCADVTKESACSALVLVLVLLLFGRRGRRGRRASLCAGPHAIKPSCQRAGLQCVLRLVLLLGCLVLATALDWLMRTRTGQQKVGLILEVVLVFHLLNEKLRIGEHNQQLNERLAANWKRLRAKQFVPPPLLAGLVLKSRLSWRRGAGGRTRDIHTG